MGKGASEGRHTCPRYRVSLRYQPVDSVLHSRFILLLFTPAPEPLIHGLRRRRLLFNVNDQDGVLRESSHRLFVSWEEKTFCEKKKVF